MVHRRRVDDHERGGEVDVGGQLQIVALADDLVALVPDRFLDVVQPQRPALDGRRGLRKAREESDGACDEHDSHGANHNSGWPLQRASVPSTLKRCVTPSTCGDTREAPRAKPP